MKRYSVTLPIAGHAVVEVEAEDEKSAIEAAMSSDVKLSDVSEWDVLARFQAGNVSYCPQPWEPEATELTDGEQE